jgi:hypothetical protein
MMPRVIVVTGGPRHAGGWRFLRSFGMSNASVRRAKASQIDIFDHVDYGRRVVGRNGIEIQFDRFIRGSINDGRKGIGSDSIAIEYATRRHFIRPPQDSLQAGIGSQACSIVPDEPAWLCVQNSQFLLQLF